MNNEERSTIDVGAIREYINTHFHEDIFLEKLADKYVTSPSYLSRLLKRNLGVSFNTYLANIRIARAKQLLESTSKSVNVIAEETGFNSRNTFIRMFKKHEGIIPSEYRRLKKKI